MCFGLFVMSSFYQGVSLEEGFLVGTAVFVASVMIYLFINLSLILALNRTD